MYMRQFWQDHVTQYDDRFKEYNNPDGTISHVPVEGEVLQEGTPQNAKNFNNLEEGIVAANELSLEVARVLGHYMWEFNRRKATVLKAVEWTTPNYPVVPAPISRALIEDYSGDIYDGFLLHEGNVEPAWVREE